MKGFVQMFSINAVGGGSLDFHLDTHRIYEQTDYGRQDRAREDSRHGNSSLSTDRDGHVHIYHDGCELASNQDFSRNPNEPDRA
jgi:hypothetical protein